LCTLAVETCYVKLLAILLVDHPLELGRDFEPSFFVHASWVIAAKHELDHVGTAALGCPGLALQGQPRLRRQKR
jgi:hypothetical protein